MLYSYAAHGKTDYETHHPIVLLIQAVMTFFNFVLQRQGTIQNEINTKVQSSKSSKFKVGLLLESKTVGRKSKNQELRHCEGVSERSEEIRLNNPQATACALRSWESLKFNRFRFKV